MYMYVHVFEYVSINAYVLPINRSKPSSLDLSEHVRHCQAELASHRGGQTTQLYQLDGVMDGTALCHTQQHASIYVMCMGLW